MGVIGVIGLIFRIITLIPTLISVGSQIIAMLPKFKGASFWEVLQLIADILRLIVGLAPKDKAKAKALMVELRDHMKTPQVSERGYANTLALFKEKVQRECTGAGCPIDTVRE